MHYGSFCQSAIPQNNVATGIRMRWLACPMACLWRQSCASIIACTSFSNDCNEQCVTLASAGIFLGSGLDPEDVAAGCGAASSIVCPALLSVSFLDFILAPQVLTLGMVTDAWMSPTRQPLHKATKQTCS